MKRTYIQNLITKINERFLSDHLDLLQCLNTVLNLKCVPNNRDEIILHGYNQLNQLIQHYEVEQNVNGALHHSLIIANRTKDDFLQFKVSMNSNKHKSLKEFLELVLNDYSEEFPDLHVLASILASIPLTSVP